MGKIYRTLEDVAKEATSDWTPQERDSFDEAIELNIKDGFDGYTKTHLDLFLASSLAKTEWDSISSEFSNHEDFVKFRGFILDHLLDCDRCFELLDKFR